ncbi:hypothetical protein [Amycolatopsis sp. NPDC098790]|uniref:M61 family metallopeptidase n=1 Tax=Amycolatopsis sp. NPDC098790 TaxID=3363939 RepID=UPI00381CF38E
MTPPALTLSLTPRPAGIDVEYTVQEPALIPDQVLCRLPILIAGVPGAPIGAAELTVTDADGAVPLREEDEPPSPSIRYRRWYPTRDTAGDVTVGYFAPVRQVDTTTKNGPLFDLRSEAGGVSGAGVTFLALPESDRDYAITLRWDGVSSLGEGTVELTGPVDRLAYGFYLAGPLKRYPEDETSSLKTYWLDEPAFDIHEVAARSLHIYEVMCDFFREPSPGHRVFVRKHPYRGNGGTALLRSFTFGWNAADVPEVDDLSDLLAHEIAHNWPSLDGEHGETAWYSEGCAEYYSIVLSHRAGLIDDAEFLERVNERARAYYTNPLQTLSNQQAAEVFWQDARAQRVPYGRGFFYLVDLNAKILAASGGARSVDDLVLAVVERRRAGDKVGVADWVRLVTDELGDQGQTDFAALQAGEWMVPGAEAFGPRFTRREVTAHTTELGFDLKSLETRVVNGLVPESAAARAGVREGDRLAQAPAEGDLARGRVKEITLTLDRGEHTIDVAYPAAGTPVRSFRWELSG